MDCLRRLTHQLLLRASVAITKTFDHTALDHFGAGSALAVSVEATVSLRDSGCEARQRAFWDLADLRCREARDRNQGGESENLHLVDVQQS